MEACVYSQAGHVSKCLLKSDKMKVIIALLKQNIHMNLKKRIAQFSFTENIQLTQSLCCEQTFPRNTYTNWWTNLFLEQAVLRTNTNSRLIETQNTLHELKNMIAKVSNNIKVCFFWNDTAKPFCSLAALLITIMRYDMAWNRDVWK